MKKYKLLTIIVCSSFLALWWLVLSLSKTQSETSNYIWQALLAFVTIVYAAFGLLTSGQWSWLKSGVGKGIFSISLGLLLWGLGQAGWAYETLANSAVEVPNAPLLDFLYFASVPTWAYGIFQLSKATGAKFGLRKLSGKLFALATFAVIGTVSYYFLVVVARGGFEAYFDTSALPEGSLPMWWIAFTDLGYAFGDAMNLALSLSIFGLAWEYLGGRFKKPIMMILAAFGGMYIADFFFSYYDGLGAYYNGHWVDLGYLAVVSLFGAALVMIDPLRVSKETTPAIASSPGESVQGCCFAASRTSKYSE